VTRENHLRLDVIDIATEAKSEFGGQVKQRASKWSISHNHQLHARAILTEFSPDLQETFDVLFWN
jgi:hypothetical protein